MGGHPVPNILGRFNALSHDPESRLPMNNFPTEAIIDFFQEGECRSRQYTMCQTGENPGPGLRNDFEGVVWEWFGDRYRQQPLLLKQQVFLFRTYPILPDQL